jgi:hypothetical protein
MSRFITQIILWRTRLLSKYYIIYLDNTLAMNNVHIHPLSINNTNPPIPHRSLDEKAQGGQIILVSDTL